jgi:GTP-binding protein HflX
MMNYL